MNETEEGQAPASVPTPQPTVPTFAPPPVPQMGDAAMQAQLAEYTAQMQASIQAQMREQYEASLRQSTEQARLQFEKWRAEQQQAQAVRQFSQDMTTATLSRMHALPVKPDALEGLLLETPSAVRGKWQALLEQINTSGLLSFEEIGSQGDGDTRSTKDLFDAAVLAKVTGGMTQFNAMQAVQREHPEWAADYNGNGRGH